MKTGICAVCRRRKVLVRSRLIKVSEAVTVWVPRRHSAERDLSRFTDRSIPRDHEKPIVTEICQGSRKLCVPGTITELPCPPPKT